MRMKSTLLALAVAILTWSLPQSAHAQINPSGTTALQDVGGGPLHGRAPGMLVSDGVGRHQEFNNFEFGITEVEAPSPRAAALVEVFSTLFEELNAAIDAFAALLIARGGGNPLSSFTGFLGNT